MRLLPRQGTMQVKSYYRKDRTHFYQACEALGISPTPKPRAFEALVFARPDRSRETLYPGIAPDFAQMQRWVRRSARALLSAGQLGSAQVSGRALVAQVSMPGRDLQAYLSGRRIIWQWKEN